MQGGLRRFVRALVLAALACAAIAAGVLPSASRAEGCRHVDVVLYTNDAQRLAQRLRANQSACADYYIVVTAGGADGLTVRPIAGLLRANGPQFHALAEIRLSSWAAWVQATGKSWYEAGLEVRDRMAKAGFDTTAGDSWAVNEVGTPSGDAVGKDVFNGVGDARTNLREFVDGMYDGAAGRAAGDPGTVQGLVFAANPAQVTTDLADYKRTLRDFYADTGFWTGMSRDVRFWAQETYADARDWGLAGSTLEQRIANLDLYYLHALTLATTTTSPDLSAARSFLASAYMPVGNGAYPQPEPESRANGIGFGFTNISVPLMQSFEATQVDALRAAGERFGFAQWFTGVTAPTIVPLEDSFAASIHTSDTDPAATCGSAGELCAGDIDQAAFNDAWDVTPPEIVPELSGPTGNNGWYTGDVTVDWQVTDDQSALTTSGCDQTVVTADTPGLTLTCDATSAGGSSQATVVVKRDATPPTLTMPRSVNIDATSPSGASVGYDATAADTLDPAPSVDCSPVSGTVFAIGDTTVTCITTDSAGNSASGSFPVHVEGAAEQLHDLAGTVAGAADIGHGTRTALLAKLDQLPDPLDPSDDARACSVLDRFARFVRIVEDADLVPAATADELVADSERIGAVLAC